MAVLKTARVRGDGPRWKPLLCGLAVAVLCVSICGCGESGPPKYPVTGAVTYQGKPLPTGAVMFFPTKGVPVGGTIAADGTYRFEAPAGTYKAAVRAVAKPRGKDPTTVSPEEAAGMSPQRQQGTLIPLKYSEIATSGLSYEVKAGEDNRIDINLE
jgi:hypothetical protein